MVLVIKYLSNGGANIDFGTCGCRFDAAEFAELHVQLAFCLLGREFVGRTREYPPVYVQVGNSFKSIRIATNNMAFEIPHEEAKQLLDKLEDPGEDGEQEQ